ncbi:MAG: hypothetical protein HDS91_02690 [Bacteroidales bacterium]|nr:hypothetical protein [Bacteroidales bacterium]
MSIAALLLTVAVGCSQQHSTPVSIERLDLAIEASDTMSVSHRDALTDSMRPGIDALSRINAFSSELIEGEGLMALRYRSALMFTPAVRERISGLATQESSLGEIRDRLASELPDVPFPSRIYAVEWPYNQSLALVNDSVMLIALNHYLGEDFEGYAGFEHYRRRLKTLDRLPYDVAEALIRSAYPYSDSASTVTSRLFYEGAVAKAVEAIVPGSHDSDVLGYDDEQMEWARSNERHVWESLVGQQLLFSSSDMDMTRLFDPSPATSIIHPEAPGRLGRFIGLRMIRSLLDHESSLTLHQLLTPRFYASPEALQAAEYHP